MKNLLKAMLSTLLTMLLAGLFGGYVLAAMYLHERGAEPAAIAMAVLGIFVMLTLIGLAFSTEDERKR